MVAIYGVEPRVALLKRAVGYTSNGVVPHQDESIRTHPPLDGPAAVALELGGEAACVADLLGVPATEGMVAM